VPDLSTEPQLPYRGGMAQDASSGADTVADTAALVVQRVRGVDVSAPMQCRVVAIDGPGGAGKSTLASQVAVALDAQVICTDDFATWEQPLEWWARLIEQVLRPLSNNQPGRYQRSDWSTRQLAEWHDVPVAPSLVLEGVSSSRAAFASYLAFRVWVRTPREERLRRGLERDGHGARDLWREWMAREDATSLPSARKSTPTWSSLAHPAVISPGSDARASFSCTQGPGHLYKRPGSEAAIVRPADIGNRPTFASIKASASRDVTRGRRGGRCPAPPGRDGAAEQVAAESAPSARCGGRGPMQVLEPVLGPLEGRRLEGFQAASAQRLDLVAEGFDASLSLGQRLRKRLTAAAFADEVDEVGEPPLLG
jgi:cytidylate kinase